MFQKVIDVLVGRPEPDGKRLCQVELKVHQMNERRLAILRAKAEVKGREHGRRPL